MPHGGLGAPRRVGEGGDLIVVLTLLSARRFGGQGQVTVETGAEFNRLTTFHKSYILTSNF